MVAHRYMLAYLRGVRFYNGAIRMGIRWPQCRGTDRTPGARNALQGPLRSTRKVVPNGCDPDGRVDRPSLDKDLAFYRETEIRRQRVGLGSAM